MSACSELHDTIDGRLKKVLHGGGLDVTPWAIPPFLSVSVTLAGIATWIVWWHWPLQHYEQLGKALNDDDRDVEDHGDKNSKQAAGIPRTPGIVQCLEGGEAASTHRSRVFYIDNCRFVLECLVIAEHIRLHFFHPVWGEWWMVGFLLWIKSFHMHMFAFCSGALSKGYLTPERAKRSVMRVLVPFVILNYFFLPLLFRVYEHRGAGIWGFLFGVGVNVPNPLIPFGQTWFLQCWLTWRCLMPFLSQLKPALLVPTAYILSCAGGYWWTCSHKPQLHMHETFAYLPFYVTGFVIPLERLAVLDKPWIKAVGCVVASASLVAFMAVQYHASVRAAATCTEYDEGKHYLAWAVAVSRKWYFSDVDVAAANPTAYWTAGTQRFAFQVLMGWPIGLAVLAMVPHGEQVWTEWGSRTMYPFIGQTLTFRIMEKTLSCLFGSKFILAHFHSTPKNMLSFCLCATLGSIAINISWACKFTRSWARYIMEPEWVYVAFVSDPKSAEVARSQ